MSFPYIRPNEDDLIRENTLQCLCSGGKYGVDTAHLIAHFPTGFKNKIWEQLVIYHIYTFMWFVKTE